MPLTTAWGVLGGVIALLIAGGDAGAVSFNSARIGRARILAAQAEFLGPRFT